jgi:hypothetical protein
MTCIQIKNLGHENQIIILSQENSLKVYGGLEKKSLVKETISSPRLPEKTTNVRVIWAH